MCTAKTRSAFLAAHRKQYRTQQQISRTTEGSSPDGEGFVALSRKPNSDPSPGSGHTNRIRRKPTRAILLHSFCRARNREPLESTRFCDHSFEERGRRRFVQAVCPRDHSTPFKGKVSHHLFLLWRRGSCLYGRGTGRTLVGFSPGWRPQCRRRSVGSNRRFYRE